METKSKSVCPVESIDVLFCSEILTCTSPVVAGRPGPHVDVTTAAGWLVIELNIL
jgi:hypothetical protein